jgi:acyl-CoA synthetase (AMP-forming)/AMP-acid ligase II
MRTIERPRPGNAIDQAVYLRAVAAEYGQAVATSLLLVPRDTIPLTSQGKPDREAIRALGRAGWHLLDSREDHDGLLEVAKKF